MVILYGHCLAQVRANIADKRPILSGEMANIDAALARCDADNPVFYEDEVDIDLNPKLGAEWMLIAQPKRVVTPSQNAKHYLIGLLHEGNGRILYVSGIKKNLSLFIAMLESCVAINDEPRPLRSIIIQRNGQLAGPSETLHGYSVSLGMAMAQRRCSIIGIRNLEN